MKEQLKDIAINEGVSTSVIAKNNNIIPKDLFNYLVQNDYLIKKGKNYKLATKGMKIGGDYCVTKEYTFIVWDEAHFNTHIIDTIKPHKNSIFKYPSKFSLILKEYGRQYDLWESLNRGTSILQNEDQLDQYLFSYGKMHHAKLAEAYVELFKELKENNKFDRDKSQIEIIDYACGQGIAAFILLNCFDRVNFPIDNILKITLIEPSTIALNRANFLLKDSAKIVQVNEKLDNIAIKDLKTNPSSIKIHLFSNILDMGDDSFSLERLAEKIKFEQKGENYFVCVSVRNQFKLTKFVENIIETKIKSPLFDFLIDDELEKSDKSIKTESEKSVLFSSETKLKNVKFISIDDSDIYQWKRIHMIFKKQFK